MSLFGRFKSSLPGDETDGNQPLLMMFPGLQNCEENSPGLVGCFFLSRLVLSFSAG